MCMLKRTFIRYIGNAALNSRMVAVYREPNGNIHIAGETPLGQPIRYRATEPETGRKYWTSLKDAVLSPAEFEAITEQWEGNPYEAGAESVYKALRFLGLDDA